MKMCEESMISSFGFDGLIRRSPTVRVLLKRGDSPVVSVSIIRRFMFRLRGLGLYCFVD